MRIKDIEQLPGKVIKKALWLDAQGAGDGIAVLFTDGDFIFISREWDTYNEPGVHTEGEVGSNGWRIEFRGLSKEEVAFFREEE